MVHIEGVDVFMNSILLSESVDGLPYRAIAGFIKRLVLDIIEPASKSNHKCSVDCKQYHEMVIGGIDNFGNFEDCCPR